ncbi:MAG: hypothetical protein KJ792_01025 [Actinobacteria bacterium]|nr:hypothetical protein [Actinomycetota bacterium]
MSTLAFFFIFRGGIWPAVVVSEECVTIRNPLSTSTIVGAARLRYVDGWPLPVIETPGREVIAFAFSASIIARLRGDKRLHSLGLALAERGPGHERPSFHRSWSGVLWQWAALQGAIAVVMVVVGVFSPTL